MDDFMSKPFTATQLASVLNIWANRLATDADEDVGPATAGSSSVEGPIAQTLDLKALDEFECLQAGMAARLAELFLSTAPKTVRQIMMAIVEGDHDKIGTAAHGLKSSSATVGAHELARLANKIEAQAKIGEPLPNCLLLAAKLEAEMCAVENALGRTKWLSNKKKAG